MTTRSPSAPRGARACDHVVGLDARHPQQRQAQRLDGGDQRIDLRPQVVGHRRPMRLVLGEQFVAERLARRVEHHANQRRILLLEQFLQHVEHTEHCAGGFTLRVGERRQRVEGPVQVRGAVHEDSVRGSATVGSGLGSCGGCSVSVWVPVQASARRWAQARPVPPARRGGRRADRDVRLLGR